MVLQILHNDGMVAAIFRLPARIWADRIALVGDFNAWSTSATLMRRGEQYWEASVTLPTGSTAYYAYLLDGADWCSEYSQDPATTDTLHTALTLIPIEIVNAQRHIELAQ